MLLPLLIALTFTNAPERVAVCSWYGEPFHGRQTASGRIYDMTELTAAHKTLPLGTIVRITNHKTNKTLDVWVTDRGPYVEGRELDLSRAAFDSLGNLEDGLMTVTWEPVGRNTEGLLYNL